MLNLFISHASEDKDSLVRPLACALKNDDLQVWYDEYELTIGDSLRRSIDAGLSRADFAVVVLSKKFFEKEWPKLELDALVSKETGSRRKLILPIWHNLDADYISKRSPILASKLAAKSDSGIPTLVNQVRKAIGLSTESSQKQGSSVSLIGLDDELQGILDSLRYALTNRYFEEIESGTLSPDLWPEMREADDWFGENRYRLPGQVRESLKHLMSGYQERLNSHLDFLRGVLTSGADNGIGSNAAREHAQRTEQLIDCYDRDANAVRKQPWL